MGLIQANFGSNMSWVDFGFVSNGLSYKQWPLHSCYRVFRWPRQISFHPKRGHMIWKQQKSKTWVSIPKVPIALCKLQGVNVKFHTRGANINQKHTHFRKNQGFDSKGFEFQSWNAMVLVQISIGQCQGAKGQRPIANYKLRLQVANCQGQIARGQGQGISQKIDKKSCKTISNSKQKTWIWIVRVSVSNHEMPWSCCKFRCANARGQVPGPNFHVQLPGAKGPRATIFHRKTKKMY